MEPSLDGQNRAPLAPSPVRCDPHPIVADFATRQWLSGSRHPDLFFAPHLAGRGEQVFEVGGPGALDLVRQLTLVAGIFQTPGEPDRLRANSQHPDAAAGSSGSAAANSAYPLVQPLTAPAAKPETIFLLKRMNMISGGMVINTTFMKSRFHWVRNWLWKLNSVSWTVAFSSPGKKYNA